MIFMDFNLKNFLFLAWAKGLHEAVKVEVVENTKFEFDDIGLQMVHGIITKYIGPK